MTRSHSSPSPYDDAFYAEGREHALRSARRVVPLVLRLVPARSVVDVGCGLGTWLSVFREHGVHDVLGVDGPHVDTRRLDVPGDCFRAADLRDGVRLERTFDLAMSLEVAEHLPEARAGALVASLCALAPVVLFSAAVPAQGGVEHVNEQWPEYWAEHFAANGYLGADCLRDELWADPGVSWWYSQNLVVWVAGDRLDQYPELSLHATESPPRAVAHPTLVERNLHRKRLTDTLIEVLARVPKGLRIAIADGAQLAGEGREIAQFEWLPFLERGGEYHGAPADGPSAVAELERMRREGTTAFAIAWPCTWWFKSYPELIAHLDARYRRIHESGNIALWRLALECFRGK